MLSDLIIGLDLNHWVPYILSLRV